ncbi:hypothetical protein [Mycolicibacterium elephantis]|uniref:hypothetical protein n=2 Tax=Mycolicibacterium elephantis TaxID=81858 RepID=UPI003A884FB6
MSGVGVVLAGAAVGFASPAAADSWTMPDLIGVDLQGAQDAIQSVSDGKVWFSSSTDLTGQGRMQVNDRAWVVCSSTPPPRAAFTTGTKIDFGVVRKGIESCP